MTQDDRLRANLHQQAIEELEQQIDLWRQQREMLEGKIERAVHELQQLRSLG
jgi:hypothetical protein